MCLEIHLGDSGGVETDVSQGQIGKEGIHEDVNMGVRDDSQNYEQVPKHGDQDIPGYTRIYSLDRKSPKRRGCRSGPSERPRMRNSERPVRF